MQRNFLFTVSEDIPHEASSVEIETFNSVKALELFYNTCNPSYGDLVLRVSAVNQEGDLVYFRCAIKPEFSIYAHKEVRKRIPAYWNLYVNPRSREEDYHIFVNGIKRIQEICKGDFSGIILVSFEEYQELFSKKTQGTSYSVQEIIKEVYT